MGVMPVPYEIILIKQIVDSLAEWIKKPDPDNFRPFIEWKQQFDRLVNNNAFIQTLRELRKHNLQYANQLIDQIIPVIIFHLGTMAKEYENRDDLFAYISASGLAKLDLLKAKPKLEQQTDEFFQKIRIVKENALEAEDILRKAVNVLKPSPVLAASVQNKLDNGIEDEPKENKAYIKKGTSMWVFRFNSGTAHVKFIPNKELKGLAIIELLLTHPNEEYTPLQLLQEVGQREKGETEPERIYTDKDIGKIKEAIKGLKGRAELATDPEKKAELEQEIEKGEDGLRKARNYKGQSRKFSEKYTKSVSRNIETVLKKIAPQNVELYNHLYTFLNRGEICCYKPDKEVFWEIS
jgi:hypothetical protein